MNLMTGKKCSIPLVVSLAIGLCGCGDQNESPKFITNAGTVELFGKKMKVEVFNAGKGILNYRITRKGTKAGPGVTALLNGDNWFIYPTSLDAVWVYDGEKNVLLIEFSEKLVKLIGLSSVPDLLNRAPAAFITRLPADLRNK